MELVLGEVLGKGSFATVRLATPRKKSSRFPTQVAVKSSSLTHAKMLLHEKTILLELKRCPFIIRCFGHDHTKQNGEIHEYNLFLEYAAGGTLADKLKIQPNKRFQESDIRTYTKSILEGVSYIHKKRYVHRDLKPDNILLSSSDDGKETAKIADFGVAKRSGEKKKKEDGDFRGTVFYLPPEALAKGEQESPSDVWAVGCIVAEMFTGTSVWQVRQGETMLDMAVRMASELPEIKTEDLSPEGRDFLEKIFIKDPSKRWTARMLLDHPFVANQPSEEAVSHRVGSTRPGLLDSIKKSSHHTSISEKFRRLLTCQRQDRDASNHKICAR